MTTDDGDAERTGWREIRDLAVAFWQGMRAGPQPLPVLYLRCDGCGNVTPRTSVVKSYSLTERGLTGGTPESVCGACRHPQPRVVDDEVPPSTTIVCTGYPHRRIGTKHRRKPCARTIIVPRQASLVLCPWCLTEQPGPAT